jgi:hypothetical protein
MVPPGAMQRATFRLGVHLNLFIMVLAAGYMNELLTRGFASKVTLRAWIRSVP